MNSRTLFLARLAGLFVLVFSLAMLVQRGAIESALYALVADRAALLVVTIVGLVGGLAMVLGHNVWSGGPVPVIVTLIGWWLLIKTAVLLLLPAEAVVALFEGFVGRLYYPVAVIDLAIGLYLTYAGFSRR
ncbi:MAG TPA: hypothetical protein VN323_21860 [Candidatus Dormibacteraeota bacterium]|jgi:hypothetical protein|nr:hypothetical protein [Candidatus Dormibacteraeota bacterium]